jgi:hypothetical protein
VVIYERDLEERIMVQTLGRLTGMDMMYGIRAKYPVDGAGTRLKRIRILRKYY